MAVAKTAPCAVVIEDMVFDEKSERKERDDFWCLTEIKKSESGEVSYLQ